MRAVRDTLYFDGACGLCVRSTRLLRALDWCGRLDMCDMCAVERAQLPVSMEQAMTGLPMRTHGGDVLIGFPALRRALLQTPIGVVPACLLYLPGVAQAGDGVYRFIARRRQRDTACVPSTHE